ncbi:MAG: acyl-CoA dehydrogenase family protein [Flavobacteriales bacterium]|jgi:alkylation response protein AidB-like acyl-CoA dehydrogenase|nr:acyl-CoA dehydrogenase family protein [Flavobacteriales bacterium]
MNFDITEDQSMIEQMVKDFAEKEIRPNVMKWDESQDFPVELFKKAGDLGLMGVLVPEEFGGAGLGYFEYISVIRGIAKVCGSIGLSIAAHNSLCTNHILKFGNQTQKEKWLPKLASGEWIGAWGLTEPNTGSDAMRMKCTAKQDGDYWVINGAKNFITHGRSGDIIVAVVRTGELLDSHGMTAFAIERGTPGFSGGKKEDKLGMRASETAEVIFDNCRVHKDNILGNVGEGFIQSMKILDGGRISIGALGLGIAEGALEASINYANEREQFGRPISSFQGISFKLADMATEIEASKLLLYQAADKIMKGLPVNKLSAMAKYKASEVGVMASTEAVQIFGGYGYIKEFPVEKFYRDSKLCTIGEGTSEIQKLVISRELLKK